MLFVYTFHHIKPLPTHFEQEQLGLLFISEREIEAQRVLWLTQDHRENEYSTREQGF